MIFITVPTDHSFFPAGIGVEMAASLMERWPTKTSFGSSCPKKTRPHQEGMLVCRKASHLIIHPKIPLAYKTIHQEIQYWLENFSPAHKTIHYKNYTNGSISPPAYTLLKIDTTDLGYYSSTTHSIEYWFRCLDIDGDGVLSLFELVYFYEEVLQRLQELNIDSISIENTVCQVLDMVNPREKGRASREILLKIIFLWSRKLW